MEEWIKVYEEMIIQQKEDITEQRIWLNDILEDQAIPYKNEFEYKDLRENLLENTRHAYVISVYVHKNNEIYAKELIREYEQAEKIEICSEDIEGVYDDGCIKEKTEEEKAIEQGEIIVVVIELISLVLCLMAMATLFFPSYLR